MLSPTKLFVAFLALSTAASAATAATTTIGTTTTATITTTASASTTSDSSACYGYSSYDACYAGLRKKCGSLNYFMMKCLAAKKALCKAAC